MALRQQDMAATGLARSGPAGPCPGDIRHSATVVHTHTAVKRCTADENDVRYDVSVQRPKADRYLTKTGIQPTGGGPGKPFV